MNFSSKFWWLATLRGIILIILSFFIFSNPPGALVALALYIGISLLFTGILEIIEAFQIKSLNGDWGWPLFGGILDLLFGIILLSNPGLTAATIPFIVGFWLIVSGIVVFVNSFSAKKAGYSGWFWYLLFGILVVIAGFSIMNNLLLGMFTLTIWMGVGFIMAGLVNLIIGFRLKPRKN